MSAPSQGYLVDAFGQPLKVGFAIDPATGAFTPISRDSAGNQNSPAVLSPSQVAAAVGVLGRQAAPGYRVALLGDSMTDFNFNVINPTSVSFDGVRTLTITISATHTSPVGSSFNFWNRSYASLNRFKLLTVASVTSTTVLTTTLPPGDYSDLPVGNLTGTSYFVPYLIRCAKSWLQWLNVYGNQRFRIVYNGAQSGNVTSDVIAQIPQALAQLPNLIAMQLAGINNITYDASGTRNDVNQVIADNKLIFDTLRAAGLPVLCGLLTPVASGEARAQRSIMQLVQLINDWAWTYARQNGGVVLVDTYGSIVNPTDTVGLASSGLLAAADHIHDTNVGGFRIARDNLARVLAAFPSYRSTLPVSTLQSRAQTVLTVSSATAASNIVTVVGSTQYIQKNQEVFIRGATGSYAVINGPQYALGSDGSGSFRFLSPVPIPDGTVTGTLVIAPSRQMFPDPLLQTATGGTASNGVTGTVAGQLTCTNAAGNTGTLTAVASVVASRSGAGNAQRIRITAAALNDLPQIQFKNSVGTIENQLVPGRSVHFEARLDCAVATSWANVPLSEIAFEMSITANSGETWRTTALNQYEAVVPWLGASDALVQTLHLRTGEITIPAGAVLNSCQCICRLRFQGTQSSDTFDMELSQIAVVDVTPDGVLALI